MKLIIQRVSHAAVEVEGERVATIGRGFLVLVGAVEGDTDADVLYLAEKCGGLRVFTDEAGKMNLALADVGGAVLSVPNFTLCADCRHGKRPSFSLAARPEAAEPLFRRFTDALRERGIPVSTGVFGAHMHVSLQNDGPVTIIMDSAEMRRPV